MSVKLPQGNPAYRAPIVLKTVELIEKILTTPRHCGVTELASELSLAKSTTHGVLASLEQAGWVLRDPITKKYSCGYALQELVRHADIRLPLAEAARPGLERIVLELDEDLFLGIFTPHYILIIDQAESTKKLKVATRPGTRIPIFAGAAGKIFLAHYDRADVEGLVRSTQLPRFTHNSITDPDDYIKELDLVRRRGVAVDMEEYILDVRAVAAPVFRGSGARKRVVAGIWAVGVASDFTEDKMRLASELIVRATKEVSIALGE